MFFGIFYEVLVSFISGTYIIQISFQMKWYYKPLQHQRLLRNLPCHQRLSQTGTPATPVPLVVSWGNLLFRTVTTMQFTIQVLTTLTRVFPTNICHTSFPESCLPIPPLHCPINRHWQTAGRPTKTLQPEYTSQVCRVIWTAAGRRRTANLNGVMRTKNMCITSTQVKYDNGFIRKVRCF